jgi:hypothetical protein
MGPEFMRRATVVMPEATVRVTVVDVVMYRVIGRRRLLCKSGGARNRAHADGKRSDDLRSQ